MLSARAPDMFDRGEAAHHDANCGSIAVLRICADSKTLTRLSVEPPASIDVTKRQTLLNCIANAPEVFFDEIGEKLLLLGSDLPGFGPGDSIDLLALDPKGSISVIELSGQARARWSS